MAIEAVKIPQNVYVEDRIIGPITLRQIMLSLAGGGVSYALWAAMKAAGPVSVTQSIFAWIPCIIFIAYAFVKINGITLTRITLLLLEKIDKPSIRVWHPRRGLHINIIIKKKSADTDSQNKKEEDAEEKFEELSAVLDRGPEEYADQTAPSEETVEPTMARIADAEKPSKSVNPKRVQTDALEQTNIDSIQHPKEEQEQPEEPSLMRDIHPPTTNG